MNLDEKWSIQQIVEHLLLSYRVGASTLRTRLDSGGGPVRASPTGMDRARRLFILGLGLFPSGLKASPETTPSLPATLRSGEELIDRLHVELSRLGTLAAEAEAVFGSRPAVLLPRLGPLSIADWRRFHLLHGMHHARQIQSIRREHSL